MPKLNKILFFEVCFVFRSLSPRTVAVSVLGSVILAFGLYNVHSFSGVTEGGQLGLVLLLNHWFRISPAISTAVITAIRLNTCRAPFEPFSPATV